MRAVALLACALAVLGGCGDPDDLEETGATATSEPSPAPATVAVRLEDTDGAFFIEGFDLQLRFQDESGEVIAEHNWTQFVQEQGAAELDAFYTSVLEQQVPAGDIVLVSDLYISPGGPIPPPPRWGTPDSNPCETPFEARPGERVEITVLFAEVGGRCALVGDEQPPPHFDGSLGALTERGGCGYAFFYAIDPDDTVLLSASAAELFTEVRDAPGTVVERTFELPADELVVEVDVGPAVRGATCNDVVGEHEVTTTYRAISGTAVLTMRIADPYGQSRGDLVLRDVVLEPEGGGDPVPMEEISWSDVQIGTEQG